MKTDSRSWFRLIFDWLEPYLPPMLFAFVLLNLFASALVLTDKYHRELSVVPSAEYPPVAIAMHIALWLVVLASQINNTVR